MQYVDTSCDWVLPIELTPSEIELIREGKISLETAKRLLAHNKLWRQRCGHDPPRK